MGGVLGWLRAVPARDGIERTNALAVQTVCIVAGTALAIALTRGLQGGAPWPLLARDFVNLGLVVATFALLRRGLGARAWRVLVAGYTANYLLWLAAMGLEFLRYELVQLPISLTVMALLLGRRWLWTGFAAASAAVIVAAMRDAGLLGSAPALGPSIPALTLPGELVAVLAIIAVLLDRFGTTVRQALEAALQREGELARANEALRAEAAAHQVTGELLVRAQKMEAVARLAGGVAHDFNNLLTVINGHVEVVREAVRDRPEVLADVEVVRQAGESAASLTRQLLAFSRRQMLRPRVLDVNDLLARTERMLRRVIGEDVRVESRLAAGLWPVRADPGQLEQVVMNLAVNARDAMPNGGTLSFATENVTLDAPGAEARRPLLPGDHVLLTVRDDGVGMDPLTLEHAFEPFYTTKGDGKGTGLGLSTVYGIVTQSGGHVAIESAPGRGTTFRIHLPRDPGRAEAPSPAPTEVPDALRGRTVLVVEDAPAVRELVRTALAAGGARVLAAASGEEGLAAAERHEGPIDLLVTDVVMPGLSGRDTAERLVARRPGLRVLFISGYTDDAILARGLLQAKLDLLEKPFTPAALVRKASEVLGRRAELPATPAAVPSAPP